MSAEALVPAVVRTTTGAQVEQLLRDLILEGRLVPGSRLREVPLASSLGVSRNTLREALRGLAELGLVTHKPHRGVVVTDLTAQDVADLYRLRTVVELAALPEIDARRVAELELATDAFAAALGCGDALEALVCDFSFHEILVAALGSSRLAAAHKRALGELRLALLQLDRTVAPPQAEDHRRIADALRRRKTSEAAFELDRHLAAAAARLQDLIHLKEAVIPPKGAENHA